MGGEHVEGQVVTFTRKDGQHILLRLSCCPDADGEGGALIAFSDITEHHRAVLETERFAHIFRHANDIILVVGMDGHVRYASPSSERVLGYPEGYRHPRGILGVLHPDDVRTGAAELAALVAGRRDTEPFTVRVRTHDGDWRVMECVGVNLLDEPSVGGVVITARDTTERERLAEQLAHRATHDPLTDLATRRLLDDRLGEALARAIRDDRRVGLCFFDLDGFKKVNDTFGHPRGDQLLVDVADRIRQVVRGGDTAARLGGDEFVVVLDPVASEAEALVAAARIRNRVVELGDQLPGIAFGVSVGVALSDIDDTPTTLLSRADAALYRAKARHDSAVELAPSDVPKTRPADRRADA
jgi:diguanylate cyclase (GGDEF)-like protein/PAS domain S-box-containing protein